MEYSTRLEQPGRESCAPCKAAPERTTGALRAKHHRDDGDNSTPKPLRPRQREAFEAVFKRLEAGVDTQLVNLPTGCGKTLLAAHIALEFERVLFLVHRRELLAQTLKTFEDVGIKAQDIGTIWGARHEIHKRFVVGMVPTVHARLDCISSDTFELVVIDEAHHATAKTWRAVAEHFTPTLRLGLSATPERSDGAPLNDLFTEVSYELNLRSAIQERLLVRPLATQIQTRVALDEVGVVAGDFNEGQLQKAVDTPARNDLVARKYREHAKGRKALVFSAGIAHAAHLAEAFQSHGVRAGYVYGNDPEREAKLAAFAKGDIQALVNALVLTEGFDQPGVGAVLLARPTKSRPLYAQMLGRGVRLAPGKADCLVLDFVDSAGRHSLVTAWNFFGHPPTSSEVLKDMTEPTPRAQRIQDAMDRLGLSVNFEVLDKQIDLLAPPPALEGFRYGAREWHLTKASEKQTAVLAKHGIDAQGWTRGQASQAIGNLPASERQRRLLLALGFDCLTHEWTAAQAALAFDEAREKGLKPNWRRLREVGL